MTIKPSLIPLDIHKGEIAVGLSLTRVYEAIECECGSVGPCDECEIEPIGYLFQVDFLLFSFAIMFIKDE
jgi:hypothetical protein